VDVEGLAELEDALDVETGADVEAALEVEGDLAVFVVIVVLVTVIEDPVSVALIVEEVELVTELQYCNAASNSLATVAFLSSQHCTH
jgi:hypothetical protein